jgi:hypothetical protein
VVKVNVQQRKKILFLAFEITCKKFVHGLDLTDITTWSQILEYKSENSTERIYLQPYVLSTLKGKKNLRIFLKFIKNLNKINYSFKNPFKLNMI